MQNLVPENIKSTINISGRINNKFYRRKVRKKRIKKIVKYNLRFELLYFDYLSIYPSIKILISFLINQYN